MHITALELGLGFRLTKNAANVSPVFRALKNKLARGTATAADIAKMQRLPRQVKQQLGLLKMMPAKGVTTGVGSIGPKVVK